MLSKEIQKIYQRACPCGRGLIVVLKSNPIDLGTRVADLLYEWSINCKDCREEHCISESEIKGIRWVALTHKPDTGIRCPLFPIHRLHGPESKS